MENENRASGPFEGIPHQPNESWDIGAISSALQQAPEAARDIAHGPGVRYALADGALTVELFPPHAERASGIVRLSTSDARHELFRQPVPAVREDGLIFQSGTHLLTLTATGALAYRRIPPERHQGLADAPNGADGPMTPVHDTESASGNAVPSQTVTQDTGANHETQTRVHYAGRLGTEPRTKQTPKGRFVMEFPVAVTIDGQEKPEWRQTVVFDAKARALDGALHKGTAVEVVAYEHAKTKTDPATGRRRDVREYYATAISLKPRTGEPAAEAPPDPRS